MADTIKRSIGNQKLPSWLADIFGLGTGTKFNDLPSELEVGSIAEFQAVNHYLRTLLNRRLSDTSLRNQKCFPYSSMVIDQNLLDDLKLTKRTHNCLKFLMSENHGEIPVNSITFGTLSQIPNMGVKSILEFLFIIEKVDSKPIGPGATNKSKNLNSVDEVDETLKNEIIELLDEFRNLSYLDEIIRGDPRFPELDANFPTETYIRGSSLMELIEAAEQSDTWSKGDRYRLQQLLSSLITKLQKYDNFPLEELFSDFIGINYKRPKERNLNALYDRFGLNEIGILTLEECGKKAGLTRERIRQLESKVYRSSKSIPGSGKLYLPHLENALNVFRSNLGSSLKDLQDKIYAKKLSKIRLSVESIILFANLFRYPADDLKITKLTKGESVLVGDSINANQIMVQLGKVYSRNGIADLNIVHELVSEFDEDIDYKEVRNVAGGSGRWISIDQNDRWWVPVKPDDIARNRLLNVADKILSVCNPIDIDELRSGYQRMANFRNSASAIYRDNQIVVPSKQAILSFFGHIEGYIVSENSISTDQQIDYKTVLGDVEKGIVEALLTSKSGLMTRAELMRYCTSRGISEGSVNTYLTYSPVVHSIGMDAHKIVGKATTVGSLSAHQQTIADKIRTKRLLVCDWHKGLLRIVIRCPEFTSNLVVGSPSNVKDMLASKKFDGLDAISKKPCGTIGVTEDGAIYGMSPFCRTSGIEENDILVMEFNMLDNTVELSVGTIDEYINMLD